MVLADLARKLLAWKGSTMDFDALADHAMKAYIQSHPSDGHARKSYPWDVKRLAKSLEWLSQLDLVQARVLELGGYGIASYVIEQQFPANHYVRTGLDLREGFPYPDHSFDVILNMETIEHVADIAYAHATVLSGVQRCLSESYRVLRIGGKMFLTTPNASSLFVIQQALRGEPPWLYPFHFREFTVKEIKILLEQAGFHVVQLQTENVWSSEDYSPLVEFMRSNVYSLEDRGDDTFILAEKKTSPPKPSGSLALPV